MSNNNDFMSSYDKIPKECRRDVTGDEVVISGISGVFPASKNVAEFMDNLNKQVNMVSKSKDVHGCGKIDGVSKFDATFFRVPFKQAMILDPISRVLLEHAYCAIFDAGINPTTLKGKKIGVFIGASYFDNSCAIYNVADKNIYAITGNGSRSMYANRISYWMDSKAPSYSIDSTESSSLVCLDKAFRSIKAGECDSAIVGGANLCLHPALTRNIESAELCKTDGDAAENYRSEAINVIFLQKLKDAKRIYAEVYHTDVRYNLNSESEFLPVRFPGLQKAFEDFLSQAYVSADEVEYIETNGSGGNSSDELEAIIKVCNKNKQTKVGNVKTFMGNSEAASGISSLTKLCLAYRNGKISAESSSELEKYIKVGKEDRSSQLIEGMHNFDKGFAAINNIGFGGLSAHVLLKGHYKKKNIDVVRTCLPSLVFASGRNEACVNKVFNILKSEPLDAEQIALLHTIHNTDIPGHTYRGYTILEANEKGQNTTLSQSVQFYSGNRRPLWFVYSGMGSQWTEMGKALLRIPTFAAAIERCKKVLEPRGVDIYEILTKSDPHLFDNILHSFVGIAAVQIGLTDLLNEMNIVPDFIIGHSLGELGCGYADGGLTTEEMILSAYCRGLVSIQTPFIHGAMAAVGLGYKELQRLCPKEIEVACHNSSTSSTISGPSGDVKQFAQYLRSQGVFTKEVNVSNIAYHSKYIEHAGPELLKLMKEVIKTPKVRSNKWLSTSTTNWDDPASKFNSAEYHTNNVVSPVYFEEAARFIPPDAVVLEIAPHGLLQAVLKRSHPSCLHISLTTRWHSNPVKKLMESLGKLYEAGFNPQIDVLYPKIEYPVSTETPFLSHLVDWEHSKDWAVLKLKENEKIRMSARELLLSIHDDDYKFLSGYVRNGKNVLPESAMLFFVWETFAKFKGEKLADTSVVFKDVNFCSEVVVTADRPLKLSIMINKGRGFVNFEMCLEDLNVVNGFIDVQQNPIYDCNCPSQEMPKHDTEENVILKTDDIYRILYNRGFKFGREFHSILSVDHKRETAVIQWSNWITLMDSLIQLKILNTTYRGVSVPKFINELTIDTEQHKKNLPKSIDVKQCYDAQIPKLNLPFRCAGVQIQHIIFEDLPISEPFGDIIEEVLYVPHINDEMKDVDNCLRILLQIVIDNVPDKEINIINALSEHATILEKIELLIDSIFRFSIAVHYFDQCTYRTARTYNTEAHLVVVDNYIENKKKLMEVEQIVLESTFILALEKSKPTTEKLMNYEIISQMHLIDQTLLLLKVKQRNAQKKKVYIYLNNEDVFTWIPQIYKEMNASHDVILISERDPYSGLLGLVRKLNKIWKTKIRLFMVDDYHAPTFSPKNRIFQKQLQKNLNINIFKQRQWGGYYSLPIKRHSINGNMTLCLSNSEDPESLTWVELKTEPQSSRTIKVHFAGLTYHDLKKVSGEVKLDKNKFGMDFCGVDKRGNEVMGLLNSGTLATTIEADKELLWPIPKHWSLEDAATVPFPYVYAYYCLIIKGKLRTGQTVFVNSGAGAVGQAVISICLALNCTIYTTVSGQDKKKFLLKLFPQLKAENIYDSKDPCFYMGLKSTNPMRCDLVICSTSGVFRKAAMKCVGALGFFLNINDQDKFSPEKLGMSYLDEDRNYINVNLASLFKPENLNERKLLQRIISEGIANGIVLPLSRVVYPTSDISRAFKLLSSRRRKGRVLIKMKVASAVSNQLTVIPRANYSSKGVYIVICDKNLLGIELVDYLVLQGVTIINIHQKTKSINGYVFEKLKTWRRNGVEVNITASNMETKEDFLNILKEGTIFGTITGIFIIQNTSSNYCKSLDQHEFVEKFKETASVVAQLDILSRCYCTELSEFVVITQTTNNVADEYVASVCEKICELRKKLGLPGLALRAHFIDQFPHQNDNKCKMEPQPIQTVFKTMDLSLKLNSGIVHTFNIKQTQQSVEKYETKDYGLRTLYEFIERDEVMANEPVVRMRTLLNTEAEASATHYTTDSCLLLIPGFEGHHHIFTSLCEGLKICSITLQLGPDLVGNSVSEMAFNIRKSMTKCHIEPKSKFYILGYSFGVNIAIELAALLENEGLEGVVYCLDSSPDTIKMHLYTLFNKRTPNELQDYILENIYKVMSGKAYDELENKLKEIEDWFSKVEACVSSLKRSGYSTQYTKSVIEAAYNRINLALNYDTETKLNSKLILIKGNKALDTGFSDEYNLSRFSKQNIEVVKINSENATFPFDTEISNVVNKYLDSNVLKMFKDNDFCMYY